MAAERDSRRIGLVSFRLEFGNSGERCRIFKYITHFLFLLNRLFLLPMLQWKPSFRSLCGRIVGILQRSAYMRCTSFCLQFSDSLCQLPPQDTVWHKGRSLYSCCSLLEPARLCRFSYMDSSPEFAAKKIRLRSHLFCLKSFWQNRLARFHLYRRVCPPHTGA